ncbi:MAG: demethylmenaquinone methyltransferase / 2-methoxy-6-polyprenyl,4-benzoquinol methylase [Frankiaceae bacterium]|jgi:demethylmenaquinone methyltransferase/2-methoxy-6-polyprenyl-1,4-benzoquinol methylase|nr:demethylmenaquinone methyltransferase / 2-methoxy-6-polyprenyl,4-benzoquinol methylase [Frankiaceae bacterium]
MTRARLDRRPDEVAAMFDGVAKRYDLMNRVMTFGLESRWRREAMEAVDPQPGMTILDLAAGTAVSSVVLASAGARVVAADFSLGMLEQGRKYGNVVSLVAGDALRLPFADDSFDVVTISFGLRNVADVDKALREMLRVTKPGGRLVICETSQPARPILRFGNRTWLRMLPTVASRFSSNPAAYRYLTESMLTWPDGDTLGRRIADSGWGGVQWRGLTFGVVALHRATRP